MPNDEETNTWVKNATAADATEMPDEGADQKGHRDSVHRRCLFAVLRRSSALVPLVPRQPFKLVCCRLLCNAS